MFSFFLKCYRTGLLTFCGSEIQKIEFDITKSDGKITFKEFDNGLYGKGKPILTKHPNIVRCVIIGKKSWGLWSNEWSMGIGECTFSKHEILYEFEKRNIKIPESLLIDFENKIYNERKYRIKNDLMK